MRRRCLCALYNEVFKYNRSGPRMCIAFIEVSHYITYIIVAQYIRLCGVQGDRFSGWSYIIYFYKLLKYIYVYNLSPANQFLNQIGIK